jgi:dipeptidyl aminopeptidase/acylaminoacyl peptidase
MLSDDDTGVIPQNSLDFYAALKKHKVPAAMYIFPEGRHGWGYNESFRYHHVWRILMIEWMMQQKILPDMIRQQN